MSVAVGSLVPSSRCFGILSAWSTRNKNTQSLFLSIPFSFPSVVSANHRDLENMFSIITVLLFALGATQVRSVAGIVLQPRRSSTPTLPTATAFAQKTPQSSLQVTPIARPHRASLQRRDVNTVCGVFQTGGICKYLKPNPHLPFSNRLL